MASLTVDPSPPPEQRLSLESIPTVDLRLLSQSELTALSLCSSHAFDLRRCDDVVIPKIDRSVFNESAGSRKQTYSRLRLAPRKPNLTSSGPTTTTNATTTAKPRPTTTLEPLDTERAENSRIIALFKHLFNSPTSDALVPVNVEYSDNVYPALGSPPVPVPMVERKRKRGRKPRSEVTPPTSTPLAEPLALALVEVEKIEEDKSGEEEREKELVNKNGVAVNLFELAKLEDPYGPEIKRRTEGRETPEELLGFVTDLEGQWGSRRKKRKIVDANEFGDFLPNGWKVLIGMKKKQGQAWLFCRRYVSPSGRYFVSCKEVSSYLLSLTSPEDLKQLSVVQFTEDSMVDNKLASENVLDVRTQTDDQPLCVASQSNDCENQQKQLYTSQTIDHEKQVILSENVQPGEVLVSSALKCHKCSTPFTEKDGLLNHLVSCHKRKRRKAGAPIEEDVMMKDGMYECQFCNKLFHERNSYFGHVGIHVKTYVKSIGGSPSVTGKKKTPDPLSTGGVSVTVSETLGSLELNAGSVAGTPNIVVGGELNVNSADSKLKVGSDAQTHSDNCNSDQRPNMSDHTELNMEAVQNNKGSSVESFDKQNEIVHTINNLEAVQNDKSSAEDSSDKQDEIVYTINNKVKQVNDSADVSAVNPISSLGVQTLLSPNENKDSPGTSGQINASECARSGISGPSSVLIGNAETCLVPDRNDVDLGNDGKFNPVSNMDRDGVSCENGLPADDEEKSPSNQNSEDRSVEYDTVDHGYDEQVKVGDDEELMIESGSDLDYDMEAADDVQYTGSLKECSAVSHEEEQKLADSKAEREMETGPWTSSGDQHEIGTPNDVGEVCTGMINETELDLCSLGKAEGTGNAEHFVDEERLSRSVLLVSKDNDPCYIGNDSEKVPAVTGLESRGSGGFQVEQTCSLEDSTGEVSNRVCEEPKSEQVTNPSNLFFTSRSNDTPLDANVLSNDESGKISPTCSPIPSGTAKAHCDISNVFGAYNIFAENNQEQNPKGTLSGLSMNHPMHEVAINNNSSVSATTTTPQLPDLDKVENSRTDKLILDFGSMTEMNARFLNNVQHETVPEVSSPFSLWGEQTCIENNQTRVYGGARGVAPQERAPDNNSLNLVGLQQPCDAGYNLNKVCTNEQRYGVQHNETGLYSRNSEAGREGIAYGNTLNLAGFQQQCDARYNLNKPCQQGFGVQHNETGAYSTSDEARRERVSYGNSLSLASVQQTCDTGYSLNKACVQQTCDTGYSLNKGYIGAIQGFSKLDGVEHSRDRDLMIGFGNTSSRPNQGVGTEFLWRGNEGNILPGGLVGSSSSQGQSSGSFQAFDFLSDKGENGLYAGSGKFDNMSSFEGLRSTVEPMEFSFLTTQNSNAQLEDPKVLSYNAEMDQGFGSSVWHQKGTTLPNMMGGHVVNAVCVWCGNQFHEDSLGCEMQAGSIGSLCPTCKARMSGQFL